VWYDAVDVDLPVAAAVEALADPCAIVGPSDGEPTAPEQGLDGPGGPGASALACGWWWRPQSRAPPRHRALLRYEHGTDEPHGERYGENAGEAPYDTRPAFFVTR
jgi:hypothetical protein